MFLAAHPLPSGIPNALGRVPVSAMGSGEPRSTLAARNCAPASPGRITLARYFGGAKKTPLKSSVAAIGAGSPLPG